MSRNPNNKRQANPDVREPDQLNSKHYKAFKQDHRAYRINQDGSISFMREVLNEREKSS
jgi:hypothetical protein